MREEVPPELPPEAFAIRGGKDMSPAVLAAAFQEHFDAVPDRPELHVGYCLSVNCLPDATPDQVALKALRPNGEMCVTQKKAIEEAGFAIEPTPEIWKKDAHCDVYVKGDCQQRPTPEQLAALSAAFGAPVPNLGSASRRRKGKEGGDLR